MNSGIYKITSIINNKIYIGSSKNIEKRFNVHKKQLNNNTHINPHLQSSWNKYGEENFVFDILEYCDISNLIEKEQFYMDKTLCYNREIGFNNCIKADRPLGYKHTEEAKKRMSLIKKEQIKKGIVKAPVYKGGTKHSEETKEKIRITKLGNKNPMFGKKEGDQHKKDRMKNMLAKERWNKGLTAKDDERIKKLAVWTNKLPPNALEHTLIDLETNISWKEKSLKHLSKICPLSYATLCRLKKDKCGKKITKKYKIIW